MSSWFNFRSVTSKEVDDEMDDGWICNKAEVVLMRHHLSRRTRVTHLIFLPGISEE